MGRGWTTSLKRVVKESLPERVTVAEGELCVHLGNAHPAAGMASAKAQGRLYGWRGMNVGEGRGGPSGKGGGRLCRVAVLHRHNGSQQLFIH